MKVVLGWLREFCPTELSADELAETLTAAGVKVEEVLWPWEGLDGVIAARVLEVRDHPGSDTLCLARVSTGAAERDVVVGVRNMVPGDVVPYAGPGARVPALPEPLGERTIRGERSEGMLCSAVELGLGDDAAGIHILPPDLALGADVMEALGVRPDVVFDLDLTRNRPDALGHLGVARDLAAHLGLDFAALLGNAFLVEKVFGWPGIGAYAIDAVLASDFAPVQGFVLVMAILYLIINLAIDIATGFLDPKVRYDG